jgi:hypothetical protein
MSSDKCKYYEWLPEPIGGDFEFPEDDFFRWRMVKGVPVIDWDRNVQAVHRGKKPVSFHFGLTNSLWLIFSAKMRKLLKRYVPEFVNVLPFRLVLQDGSEVKAYGVGQLLLVDCLDRDRTKVKNNWMPVNDFGDVGAYDPIVLNRTLIADNVLFRVKGKCSMVVVRDDLKEIIEHAGFDGQRFNELEVTKSSRKSPLNVRKMFRESAKLIAAVAEDPPLIASGMGQWLDYCDKVAPEWNSLWTRLRTLDYQADADRLTRWLTRLFKKEPPSGKINGLWFGLSSPFAAGGTTRQMYVGGSSEFNPDSESNEWVCKLRYRPKGRYAKSSVLAELYGSVEPIIEDDICYLGEPFLCHGYLALLVSNWCHGPMRATLLANARVRAVVMGHDEGDFYRMAVLRASQRARISRASHS